MIEYVDDPGASRTPLGLSEQLQAYADQLRRAAAGPAKFSEEIVKIEVDDLP